MKKASILALVLAGLLVAATSSATEECQARCADRQQNLNKLWQNPSAPGVTPAQHRQEVLRSLEALNACMAACGEASAPVLEQPIAEPVVPAPPGNQGRGASAPARNR